MVKAKKGKKDSIRDEEVDSDVDVKTTHIANDSDSEVGTVQKTKKSKDKKKSGAKKEVSDGDSDVEVLAKNVKKMTVKSKGKKKNKVSDDEDDLEDDISKKSKSKKGGFALLNIDSDNDDESDIEEKPVSDEEMDVKPKKGKAKRQDSLEEDVKPKEPTGGKKSKKAKKKRNDSDEDIDQVLAELALEYAGEKKEPEPEAATGKKEKKSKKKEEVQVEEKDADVEDDDEEETGGMKTAAQKKKEKKERQKRESALLKQQAAASAAKSAESKQKKTPVVEKEKSVEIETPVEIEKVMEIEKPVEKDDAESELPGETEEDGTKVKDDKKKKKKEKGKPEEKKKEEEKEKTRKGPSKSAVAAMQESLRKMKEEEERLRKEEEEKIRIAEEVETMRLEHLRLEQERRDKRKQKEKERKDRLKAEGKLLSTKQKLDKARAQAMLDSLKAQGVDLPEVNEKRTRPGTRQRPKTKDQSQEQSTKDDPSSEQKDIDETSDNESKDQDEEIPEIVPEVVKEAWDVSSSSEEEEESEEIEKPPVTAVAKPVKAPPTKAPVKKQKSIDKSETESSSDESDDDSEESEVEMNEQQKVDAEMRKQRVRVRIAKRRTDAELKQTTDNLRAAVVCVLGHVDTGKTKILDKLRRTNVQDGEAGGITQQIGATNVPIDAIKEQTKIVKGFADMTFKLPGLLIIDTPGHESFSNLRNRGSSLCDIAILVVDIMHGLEPQTIESLNLLKSRKTPFVVALNKIDRLYDWQTMVRKDVRDGIKGQQSNTQLEFTQRTKEVILQFAEQGLNAALFYENPDIRTYVSMVPTSAITGEGMGNLLFLIIESCQTLLAKRLMYSEDLLATVLEVKAIPGLGTTIDAILINGKLREGETMILAGTDGPIVTQIRSLLMPQPMKELRVKNAYIEHKEIMAAQGVKIAAKELEKAIAGLNLQIAQKTDEVEIFREEVAKELKSALSSIKLSALGVYVQASTLGSLEALLEYLRTSKIPYAGIRIGPVVKRDVMKASTMLEHEAQYSTILAFDVKIERDAQDLADTLGVKIFHADIIYHLFDKFMSYRNELKKKKRDEFKSIAVFPCKLKIIPQFIFNSRDPIVIGVMVEAGIVKEGTPICVPAKEFVELGIVTSIECNHKQIETARKGQEVCIKIEPIPGEAPKMFGRHFEETDMLVSKISRQSIDACKEYFRDDLIKADWALMVDLKKQFQIL